METAVLVWQMQGWQEKEEQAPVQATGENIGGFVCLRLGSPGSEDYRVQLKPSQQEFGGEVWGERGREFQTHNFLTT